MTFSSPSWRSLNPSKRVTFSPSQKRSLIWITRNGCVFPIVFFPTQRLKQFLMAQKVGRLLGRENMIWLVVSKIFIFTPILGKIPNLTNVLLMGWKHQLDDDFSTAQSNIRVRNGWVRICFGTYFLFYPPPKFEPPETQKMTQKPWSSFFQVTFWSPKWRSRFAVEKVTNKTPKKVTTGRTWKPEVFFHFSQLAPIICVTFPLEVDHEFSKNVTFRISSVPKMEGFLNRLFWPAIFWGWVTSLT